MKKLALLSVFLMVACTLSYSQVLLEGKYKVVSPFRQNTAGLYSSEVDGIKSWGIAVPSSNPFSEMFAFPIGSSVSECIETCTMLIKLMNIISKESGVNLTFGHKKYHFMQEIRLEINFFWISSDDNNGIGNIREPELKQCLEYFRKLEKTTANKPK